MTDQYTLSASLTGHSQDVRALTTIGSRTIVSTSRDATAKVWQLDEVTKQWQISRNLNDSDGKFISSATTTTINGEDFIVLGSSSSLITLWHLDPSKADDPSRPSYTLVAHQANVCALDGNSEGVVVSGSWDKTAIIWRDFKVVAKIISHKESVWAVALVGDRVLTGSADKTIQLHDLSGTVLSSYTGHTDCVRSICLGADSSDFWSVGNDANVIQWSFDSPQPKRVLQGHTSFIYSVARLPGGKGVVTSGEDGSVRLWSDSPRQVMILPAVSVWTVAVLDNGDIASGSNDGVVRVFTVEQERRAAEDDLKAFENAVATRQINKTQVGDVKHTDLSGPEALGRPGKKEGQVIMIKNNGKVEAYQWQGSASTWQQIGEVVDAVGSSRKQVYQGKEWDYVFDVDIAEGAPPLKLPYNASENPYHAAQRFLEKNELPMSYVDQVVKFIETNTSGTTLGSGGAAYQDPFTGAGGYRPTSSSQSGQGNQSSYRDPLTGGGAYSSTPAPAAVQTFTPIRQCQYFTQLNLNAAKGKIADFDTQLGDEKLSSKEKSNLDEIYAQVGLPAAAQPVPDGSSQTNERWSVDLFLDTIARWPSDKRFPLLDITRLLCAKSAALGAYQSATGDNIIDRLLVFCDWASDWKSDKARETNTLLVARALANLPATETGRKTLSSERLPELLSYLSSRHAFEHFNKNTRVAFATFALNLSVMALDGQLGAGANVAQALQQFIANILANETEDGETAYRAMVALGNLSVSPSLSGHLIAGDMEVAKALAQGLADRIGEPRLKSTAQSI